MKKGYLLIISLLLVLFTTNVKAFTFSCSGCQNSESGDGSCNYHDVFYCDIDGDETRYDYIKGTVTTNDYVKCSLASTSLDNIYDASRTFNVKGTPTGRPIIQIECEITGQLKYNTYVTPRIEDFEYSVNKSISGESLTAITPNNAGIKINQMDASQIIEKNRDTTHDDSLIKNLSIKGQPINFSKYKTEYDITVPYEVDALELSIELNRADSTYEMQGDPKKLVVGENIIDIIVTSKKQNVTWYTLTVTRNPEGKTVYKSGKDATLKGLAVDGYDLDFKTDKDTYEITIKKGTKSLHVSATPTVNGATYKVNYPSQYRSGQKIEVIVTSEDSSTNKTYVINIKGNGGGNSGMDETIIYILIFVGTIIIVGGLLVFVFIKFIKKKGPKVPKKGKEEEHVEMPLPKEPSFVVPNRAPVQPETQLGLPTTNANNYPPRPVAPPPPVTQPTTFGGTQPVQGNLGIPQVNSNPPQQPNNNQKF